MSECKDLVHRFGQPDHYEDYFKGIEHIDVEQEFKNFHAGKGKQTDDYEKARQRFLKILGQKRMVWKSVTEEFDLDVEVCQIHRREQHDYFAFMRIQPLGFRSERTVPNGVELVFHLLTGRVIFTHRKRTKTINSGMYIVIGSRSSYSMRCCSTTQTAYLVFRLVRKNRVPRVEDLIL